jgi:hypothetical protein
MAIYIKQINDSYLDFMYYPAIYSLLHLIPLMYHKTPILFTNETIVEGDIFIWVGVPYMQGNHYIQELKKKNIYIIHFNLEPYVEDVGSDETWTYSLYMFEKHKCLSKIIRFIPIIHDETLPKTNYLNKLNELTFIGGIHDGRVDKAKIINESDVNINCINHLWTTEEYNFFIINHASIYLNLTKSDTKTLPSVRINKLLSHKCIIISEKTNDKDEELYKDMVFFRELNEIGPLFKSLIAMSPEELNQIAESAHEKFISKFNRENAFQIIKTFTPA